MRAEEFERGVAEDGEDETGYLLRSEEMRRRLLAALEREEGISFEEAAARLGLEEE